MNFMKEDNKKINVSYDNLSVPEVHTGKHKEKEEQEEEEPCETAIPEIHIRRHHRI